ncbi:hypothetical protein KIM372_06770 [Bombiscardovia nodaiensis]|uniref:DUF3027 domain-containing protein n=1 Tax=Bombiscardovia nodaiensis TaxID=2932181 RepID=A0ABN6S987_9BIFI|nr:hypothetical protein KIM372_06770 [Bombiscardovia nodaiensis]
MPKDQQKPEDLARSVALSVASEPSEVGEFIGQTQLEDGVSEFRFTSRIQGYEGWLWLVTLYHDSAADQWTVDESSLVPGPDALLPAKWIPWKDRLLPSDLSVTDAMGTEDDDPRLEAGFVADKADTSSKAHSAQAEGQQQESGAESSEQGGAVFKRAEAQHGESQSPAQSSVAEQESGRQDQEDERESSWIRTSQEDLQDAVEEFALSRRHVLSPLGREQTAKRWYEGQHGPKSLSTRTARGKTCQTCGFLIPLQGELGTMFGVCSNRWSPDDGRVVSFDHGCGEHSEIEPPEASHLWVQSKPAFDDLHIDVVEQAPREERPEVELIEQLSDDGDEP